MDFKKVLVVAGAIIVGNLLYSMLMAPRVQTTAVVN